MSFVRVYYIMIL